MATTSNSPRRSKRIKRPSRPFSPTTTSKQSSSPPSLTRPRRTRTERWERDLLPSDRDESNADSSSDDASQPKYEWDMKDFPDLCAAVQSVIDEAEGEPTHLPSESNPATLIHDSATPPQTQSKPGSPSPADFELGTPASAATTPHSSEPEIDTTPEVDKAEPHTHKSAFVAPTPHTPSNYNLVGAVVVYFPLSRPDEAQSPQTSHAVVRAKQGSSDNDSQQYDLPPPDSYSVVTILSSDSESETDLQAQHTALHATLLQTRASFASSPHVLDAQAELKKFNHEYKAPAEEATPLETELHRMHAEISFMWSVIRKGRHAGRRKNGVEASNGASESESNNDSKDSDTQAAGDDFAAETSPAE